MSSNAVRLQKFGTRQDVEKFEWMSLGLLAPALVLLVGLFLIPVGYACYLAFTNLTLSGIGAQHSSFTGTANLVRLQHDALFHHSVVVTLIFIGGTILGQSVLGLALALLMRRSLAAIRVGVGTVVVVAWVIPEITAAVVWYGFSQSAGPLAVLTGDSNRSWLISAPLLIVCIASTWRNTALSMLIFAAGLRNIPSEVDEAAAMEGASSWQRLRLVTLPLLRASLLTNLLLSLLLNLASFTLIYGMTQGGPANATLTLPVYAYQQAFQYYNFGYSTTISLVIVVIGALLGLISIRRSRPAR